MPDFTNTPDGRNAMSKFALAAIAMAATLAGAPALAADTLIDTYGPDGAVGEFSWSLFDALATDGTAQSLAVQFTALAATRLSGIQTSIAGIGSYSLSIVADSSGSPTGAAVYSTSLLNPVSNSVISGLAIDLGAGTYWLKAIADPNGGGTWVGGGADAAQPWAFTNRSTDSGWIPTGPVDAPAARLFISAVPEPGSWALLLGGAVLLPMLRRRRTMD
jgi:hypothetical protein